MSSYCFQHCFQTHRERERKTRYTHRLNLISDGIRNRNRKNQQREDMTYNKYVYILPLYWEISKKNKLYTYVHVYIMQKNCVYIKRSENYDDNKLHFIIAPHPSPFPRTHHDKCNFIHLQSRESKSIYERTFI